MEFPSQAELLCVEPLLWGELQKDRASPVCSTQASVKQNPGHEGQAWDRGQGVTQRWTWRTLFFSEFSATVFRWAERNFSVSKWCSGRSWIWNILFSGWIKCCIWAAPSQVKVIPTSLFSVLSRSRGSSLRLASMKSAYLSGGRRKKRMRLASSVKCGLTLFKEPGFNMHKTFSCISKYRSLKCTCWRWFNDLQAFPEVRGELSQWVSASDASGTRPACPFSLTVAPSTGSSHCTSCPENLTETLTFLA